VPATDFINSSGFEVANHAIQNFAVHGLEKAIVNVIFVRTLGLGPRETLVISFIGARECPEEFDLLRFAQVDSRET
jgi:hypothetical protein